MEELSTANSGVLDNRCVFTTVISSNLSILNGAPLIICLAVQLDGSGGTLAAGLRRIIVCGATLFNVLAFKKISSFKYLVLCVSLLNFI